MAPLHYTGAKWDSVGAAHVVACACLAAAGQTDRQEQEHSTHCYDAFAQRRPVAHRSQLSLDWMAGQIASGVLLVHGQIISSPGSPLTNARCGAFLRT